MGYKDALDNVLREIAIMKKLEHPNVIQLYEVIDDEVGDKLYMVMDYAKYGEVMKWNIKTLTFTPYDPKKEILLESEIKKLMRNCIRGLHYCIITQII